MNNKSTNFIIHPSSFRLLADLWLHEPDADTLTRAVGELGLPAADAAELAAAYADVFLLNVPPYGTAFTDAFGELNGPEAQRVARLYAAYGYCPPELNEVGAPDHVGLCLGFIHHVETFHRNIATNDFLQWIPICCLAVEREPAAHPFYRALAKLTREAMLEAAPIPNTQYPIHHSSFTIHHSDFSLRDLVCFCLAPARCGVYLSRAHLGQIGRGLGMRLPFGSRFEVAEALFTAAGEAELVERLIAALEAETEEWTMLYRRWAEAYPAWQPLAQDWLARTAETSRRLAEMRQTVEAERV